MKTKHILPHLAVLTLALAGTVTSFGQPPDGGPDNNGGPPAFGGRGGRGPGGFGGGGVQEKQKLTKQFDKNGDGVLDAAERKAAYDFLQQQGGGRRGGFGGRGGNQEPGQPGV